MSAAIRAQRERHAAPKLIAAEPAESPSTTEPPPAEPPPKRLRDRLRASK